MSLAEFRFFVVDYNRAVQPQLNFMPEVAHWFREKGPFYFCPTPFLLPFALGSALLIGLFLVLPSWRRRTSDRTFRLGLLLLLVAGGSLLEVRFLHRYPTLYPQHFLMWSCAVTLVHAYAAARFFDLPARRWRAWLEPAGIAAAVLLAASEMVPRLGAPPGLQFWQDQSFLQRSLRPGETVWLEPDRHPIGVADASYHWFGLLDIVPATLQYAQTPPGNRFLPQMSEADLPPCQILADRSSARFIENEDTLLAFPRARRCFEELRARGRIAHSGVPGVWEVKRPEVDQPAYLRPSEVESR
jgi:hypothetical protein